MHWLNLGERGLTCMCVRMRTVRGSIHMYSTYSMYVLYVLFLLRVDLGRAFSKIKDGTYSASSKCY